MYSRSSLSSFTIRRAGGDGPLEQKRRYFAPPPLFSAWVAFQKARRPAPAERRVAIDTPPALINSSNLRERLQRNAVLPPAG